MKPRLLVISHTPHYRDAGTIVGWAPTIREIDRLASRFSSIRHIACLHDENPPSSAIGYEASNIALVPVPPSGGSGLRAKIGALATLPAYARVISRELRSADVVHVRAPASIALVAMLQLRRHPELPCWFKYAGEWRPRGRDHASYAVQRWLLSHQRGRAVVTVNGQWPDQPSYVRAFHNPSLTDSDLSAGSACARTKRFDGPLRLLFVGSLLDFKGADRAIAALSGARARGIDAVLEITGDGPERVHCEKMATDLGCRGHVSFSGWQPPPEIQKAYARSHLLLLPSETEGWPKVVSEGMAFGVVPIVGDVSALKHQLELFGTGRALPPRDVAAWVTCIADYAHSAERWKGESERAVASASHFSFTHYLGAVDGLLAELGVSA